MSDSSKEQRRTLDEWYKLVTQCRQSDTGLAEITLAPKEKVSYKKYFLSRI